MLLLCPEMEMQWLVVSNYWMVNSGWLSLPVG